MATIKEYYEKDFGHCIRMHIFFQFKNEKIKGSILFDAQGNCSFLAIYIHNKDWIFQQFAEFLETIEFGKSKVIFDSMITLPRGKEFPGQLKFENSGDFEIKGKFFGDSEWINIKSLETSGRIFIYTESNLIEEEILKLKEEAKRKKHDLQFRAEKFRMERSKHEKPLAFISHDSDDKDAVAKEIALYLQSRICPVWYDEFSLKVGDNLRESIEKGLKECKKCILILSPSFVSNKGWGKKEFDSIFTREILEEKKLVLPVWYNVSEKDVYEYSPGLLNVVGLNWNKLGKEEVCKRLHKVIES